MNKEELLKEFDKKFIGQVFEHLSGNEFVNITDDVKEFFFDTILPEVLRDIIPLEINANHNDMEYGWNSSIENIKRKAKEKYNITL